MIKPIFFPFAHITQTEMDRITRFFEPFVHLPPCGENQVDSVVSEAVEKGRMTVHYPGGRTLEAVERQGEGYRELARMNRDGKAGLREFLRMGPFLKSDTFVGGIRSEIEKGARPAENTRESAQDANRDLLFLYLSAVFDREKRAVESEFQSVKASERRLFEAMKGEGALQDFSAASGFRLEDLGEYMTEERIHAWARYSEETLPVPEPGVLPVYVTSSPSVFEYMISSAQSAINILDIEHFRVHEEECENQHQWKKEWRDFIHCLLESDDDKAQSACPDPVDDGCGRNATFRLRLLEGGDAVHMFRHAGESLPVCLIEK